MRHWYLSAAAEEEEPGIEMFEQQQDSESNEASGSSDGEDFEADMARPGSSGRVSADASCPVLRSSRDPSEEANVIRKAFKIKLTGTDLPPPLHSFAELAAKFGCSRRLVAALAANGFLEPTPIQRQAMTCILHDRDLLAVAPTGGA